MVRKLTTRRTDVQCLGKKPGKIAVSLERRQKTMLMVKGKLKLRIKK